MPLSPWAAAYIDRDHWEIVALKIEQEFWTRKQDQLQPAKLVGLVIAELAKSRGTAGQLLIVEAIGGDWNPGAWRGKQRFGLLPDQLFAALPISPTMQLATMVGDRFSHLGDFAFLEDPGSGHVYVLHDCYSEDLLPFQNIAAAPESLSTVVDIGTGDLNRPAADGTKHGQL